MRGGIFTGMGLKCLCASLVLLFGALTHGAETNQMRTIFKGTFSGIQEQCQLVVTNQTAWEALWKRHVAHLEPKEAPPKVDFEKETVLVAAQGRQRTGGHSIEIVDFKKMDEKTVVRYRTRKPAPGGITLQALTAPVHIVAVPRLGGKVEFKAVE
jgi:hypothetical protein